MIATLGRISLVSMLSILALLGAHASEGLCDSGGQPALGIVQLTGGSAGTTTYLDDRNYLTGNGIWLYAESNGVWTQKDAGAYFGDPQHVDLQRGTVCGAQILGPHRCVVPSDNAEVCTDDSPAGPDTLIF